MTGKIEHKGAKTPPHEPNAARLSAGEWLITGLLLAALCASVPAVWTKFEPLHIGQDYRLPYELGNDYWLYSQYCRRMCGGDKILLVGDSVVWGDYVRPDETLTHCLNAMDGGDRFVNMGVDGIHPAALLGLVTHYGRAIRRQPVVLHFNPLWMSSKRHDLQTTREFQFNHPRLVPQFFPNIPCYKESYAGRVSIIIERYLPFRAWMNHLAIAYLGGADPATWLREHPYENLFAQITFQLPEPDTAPRHEQLPWTETVGKPASFECVDASTSIQWQSFQRTVDTLFNRGNSVFVIVGPFNEHMIKPEHRPAYEAIKTRVAQWLRERGVAHYVPAVLPSERYADASHPLGEGYAMLAREVYNSIEFVQFLERTKPRI